MNPNQLLRSCLLFWRLFPRREPFGSYSGHKSAWGKLLLIRLCIVRPNSGRITGKPEVTLSLLRIKALSRYPTEGLLSGDLEQTGLQLFTLRLPLLRSPPSPSVPTSLRQV